MPSGAAGNQMRAKYAPINRGTIRYGNDHDSRHHIQPETRGQASTLTGSFTRNAHTSAECVTRHPHAP